MKTQIRKCIVSRTAQLSTEHWGKSFNEVLAIAPADSVLYLNKYEDGDIGFQWSAESVIASSSTATQSDYNRAYFEIF